MGKGSGRRPMAISQKEMDARWNYMFRKDNLDLTFDKWVAHQDAIQKALGAQSATEKL